MALDYNIKFSDTSKPGIIIKPKEQNNDTTLTLFGRDFEQWGQLYNENVLKLLDNWHNDHEPGYAGQVLEGQLWYDQFEDTLKLCVSSDPLEWDAIANKESPPLSNYVTQASYDAVMKNYIPLKGNTTPAGPILVINDNDPDSLATRKYVEAKACACSKNKFAIASEVPFISQQGGPITTQLLVPEDPHGSGEPADMFHAATKKFVKENILMGYDIHTDESRIFKSVTGVSISPNSMMASTVEHGSDILITISGEFIMPDGAGEGKLTLNDADTIFSRTFGVKNDVDSYYVLLQGAAENMDSTSNTGKTNELYVSDITPPDITIKRDSTTGVAKGYLTIYWILKPPAVVLRAAAVLPPTSPRGVQAQSGGDGVTVNDYDFSGYVGKINVNYNSYGVPDKFEILLDGVVVAATQFTVSDAESMSSWNTRVSPDIKVGDVTAWVSGSGTISYDYTGTGKISIRVTGAPLVNGTVCDYGLTCG